MLNTWCHMTKVLFCPSLSKSFCNNHFLVNYLNIIAVYFKSSHKIHDCNIICSVQIGGYHFSIPNKHKAPFLFSVVSFPVLPYVKTTFSPFSNVAAKSYSSEYIAWSLLAVKYSSRCINTFLMVVQVKRKDKCLQLRAVIVVIMSHIE